MLRATIVGVFCLAATWLYAPEPGGTLTSGPQPGKTLPGPFDAFTIYSGVAKKLDQEVAKFKEDRQRDLDDGNKEAHSELLRLEKKAALARNTQHCLVSEYGLNPVVMAFLREPGMDKDGPLKTLLAKLEQLTQRYEKLYFASCVVFLSADARSSANSTETDPAKLVAEALARTALTQRLETRAKEQKLVVLAHHPLAGPAGYDLNPKAEATILFYYKQKVLANYSFAEGKLTDEAIEGLAKDIDDQAAKIKKK